MIGIGHKEGNTAQLQLLNRLYDILGPKTSSIVLEHRDIDKDNRRMKNRILLSLFFATYKYREMAVKKELPVCCS